MAGARNAHLQGHSALRYRSIAPPGCQWSSSPAREDLDLRSAYGEYDLRSLKLEGLGLFSSNLAIDQSNQVTQKISNITNIEPCIVNGYKDRIP